MSLAPLTLDLSAILRPGVYLLRHGTRVVYIGKARCILSAIVNHVIRNRTRLPSWVPIPVINFDGLEIIPCDPARAITLQVALIDLHRPHHNTQPKAATVESNPPALDGDILPPTPVRQPSAPTTVRRL